ncbi:Kelch repeat-containing protein [Planctomicrobium sp. SH661]|uniref:Kelch repeat-containing protein n=1 Tax=Planctomicrobium sp. SH661 TaxID=3448124 RepID=UPI003F5BD26D
MRLPRIVLQTFLTLSLMTGAAQAHFIWVVAEPAEQPNVAKVYLSEEAGPDDPELLPNIAAAKTWLVAGRGEPKEVTLKIDGDALVGEIPEKWAERTVVVNHNYGVMSRGGAPFLLKYYGKTYPSQLAGTWKPVGNADILPLEINPQLSGKTLTLSVTWEGQPAAGCQVTVEGPGIKEKVQGDTDEQGHFTAQVSEPGLYSIRARKEETAAGELDGKKYEQIKHYSTLSLRLAPTSLTPIDDHLPALSKGTTSFGAAVIGDDLYIYGGHLGGAHSYAVEDQSNELLRLNLKQPEKWEVLEGGPRRTGLAMIAHGGKLYRIGGFEVQGSEEENLRSQADFARFDPAIGKWEELAPLPDRRSSHDAVVIGDTLYVAGGWTMTPGDELEHDWLKTAWSCDLSQAKPEWKEITAVPFQRRAVSLATREGKLYVIGGMQPDEKTTTRVDIYDPATGTWSVGPSILGAPLDGFGTSSFGLNGQLITTTMSGSIQRLSADGSKWEFIGQLAHPRFFHEITPWQQSLIVVGGASMETGKVKELERIPVDHSDAADQKAALVN